MYNIENMDIIANVTTEIIKDSIKGAWERVKNFFKDLDARESIEYGRAYEKYLENTEVKNGKIKTLIYRSVPKNLYSFYECLGVRYDNKSIDTSSINNLIHDESKILITGTGGIGKSILFKHLFLNATKETSLIPILIELRSFNSIDTKDISLFDMLFQSLIDNGFRLEKKYFEYSMEQGGYIILLDGYDELNREGIEKVTKEIKSLCNKYNGNKYIVSSRPTEEFIGWNDFAEMTIMSLTKVQALSLIEKIEFDGSIKKIFSKELDEQLYEKYESFASNPLLLNIMLLTFDNNASIPDRLNDFYEQAFSTLFNRHDATKDAFVRDIRSGIGCEDFKLVFSHLCFQSYFRNVFEFSDSNLHKYIKNAKEKTNKNMFKIEDFQDDLSISVCMLVREGLNYRFSHRSFQEYFAALYTCKLTDGIQGKILANWMKESISIKSDSYLTMLYNMQSEKVNKIVFCPALKLIKNKYEKHGFTIELLNDLFKGIIVNKISYGEDEFALGLSIKNRYYCYALMLACELNNYTPETNDEEDNAIIQKLYRFQKKKEKSYLLLFEEAVDYVGKENLLKTLEWYHKKMLFGFSLIEKYSNKATSRKRKVATILDEL